MIIGRILLWYLLSRAVVVAGMAITAAHTGLGFDHLFREWDASWYLFVAGHGYPAHPVAMQRWLIQMGPTQEWAIAFFPGYPLAIAALGATGLPAVIAGVAISLICGFLATYGVSRLGELCFGATVGEWAGILFCVFPGALVFSWVYTEALSLALAAACLYALLRSRWLLAGLLAGAAGAVHADIAVALLFASVAAAAQAIYQRREWRSLLAPILAPAGVVAYLGYLQFHTGSWRNWLRSERTGWHQGVDFGARELHAVIQGISRPLHPAALLTLFGAGVCLWFVIALWRHPLPAPLTVAAVTVLALSFSSSDVGLRPRALLAAAPAFISVAASLGRWGTRAAAMASLVITPLLVLLYLSTLKAIP